MHVHDPDYTSKSDEELLSLALETELLTEQGRDSLSLELRGRNLDSPDRLESFAKEQGRYKHLDDIDLGRMGLSSRGMGWRLYGRSNFEVRGTGEEYDATKFAVVLYFPMVPTATYRLLHEQGSKEFQVLAKNLLTGFALESFG